jgi:hypothetical protein
MLHLSGNLMQCRNNGVECRDAILGVRDIKHSIHMPRSCTNLHKPTLVGANLCVRPLEEFTTNYEFFLK